MLSYGDFFARIEGEADAKNHRVFDESGAGLLATVDESYEVYANLARNGFWQGKALTPPHCVPSNLCVEPSFLNTS